MHTERQQGFTLIEIMAVMLIIGLAIGMVSISVGDGGEGQKTRAAARALYQSITLAAEESVYRRQQYGLRFDIDNSGDNDRYSYEWLVYKSEDKRWLSLETPELSKSSLPETILLSLEVEEQEITIGQQEREDPIFAVKKQKDEEYELHPDIYFFSSGEMQNFTIALNMVEEAVDDPLYQIKGNMLGQIDFIGPEDADDE